MVRHPSPYLVTKEREPDLVEFGKRIEGFRQRHELSLRHVSRLCGGEAVMAKSTLTHLITATGTRRLAQRLQPKIAAALRAYLKEQGLKAGEITAELAGIEDVSFRTPYQIQETDYSALATWGARLEAFRQSYNLSYRQLWFACGGKAVITQNTVMSICQGGHIYKEQFVKGRLAEQLRAHLLRMGHTPTQAAELIEKIFNGEEQTMIAPRTTLPADAQKYFGLRRDPFTGDPRSRTEVFTTPQLDKIAAQIEDAINYQGFLVVTGEIGSGKTMIKRRVIENVEKSNGRLRLFWPEFFNMDRVHSGSIVSYLLSSFDQTVPSDLVSRAAKLRRVLASYSEQGVRVALGFDECHHLHDRLLTALKNFWELGSGGYDRYLGVVLFGQPQFEGRLHDEEFREICERLEVVRMPSLEKYAWDYIAHRLKHAGGDADRFFERDAVKRLAKQAMTPLALGNLANAALLKAHSLGERKVLAAFIKDIDGEPQVRAIARRAS
jgi:type II secretory pathway predicted ATPase ExeA